ncbi:hypothetical protein DFH09DRAFT_1306559 [Mycena vulgaris]|nr:hypothetical protein DFH09DRAFT_1306559 [Mycena vulgaris]
MQLKSLLLPFLILASGSSIHASTTAFTTWHEGDVAIGGRTLVARTTTSTATATRVTGTTLTVTKTSAKPTSTSASCNWCECFTALAAEGLACAAAVIEGGCNILADLSCIVDGIALAKAIVTKVPRLPLIGLMSSLIILYWVLWDGWRVRIVEIEEEKYRTQPGDVLGDRNCLRCCDVDSTLALAWEGRNSCKTKTNGIDHLLEAFSEIRSPFYVDRAPLDFHDAMAL